MNPLQSAAGTSSHPRAPSAVLSQGNRAGGGRLGHPRRSGVRGSCREGFVLTLRRQRVRREPLSIAPAGYWLRSLVASRPRGVFMVQVAGVWHSPPLPALARSASRSLAGIPRCTTRWWTFPKNTWKGRTRASCGGRQCALQRMAWKQCRAMGVDAASRLCQVTGCRWLCWGDCRQK